jgi:hypothetical protein
MMKQILIVAAIVASASAFAPSSRCVCVFAPVVGNLTLVPVAFESTEHLVVLLEKDDSGLCCHFFWFSHNYFSPAFSLACLCYLSNLNVNDRAFVSKTALNNEAYKGWKETDFEGDLSKLQAEAEKRLADKISELQANIEKAGANWKAKQAKTWDRGVQE